MGLFMKENGFKINEKEWELKFGKMVIDILDERFSN